MRILRSNTLQPPFNNTCARLRLTWGDVGLSGVWLAPATEARGSAPKTAYVEHVEMRRNAECRAGVQARSEVYQVEMRCLYGVGLCRLWEDATDYARRPEVLGPERAPGEARSQDRVHEIVYNGIVCTTAIAWSTASVNHPRQPCRHIELVRFDGLGSCAKKSECRGSGPGIRGSELRTRNPDSGLWDRVRDF